MKQREEALAVLTPPLRKLFATIEKHGPMGAPALRVDLPLNGDGDYWRGRGDGMTIELRKLQAAGLIRQVGTDPSRPGPATRIYGVTPEDEILKAAASFKRSRPSTRKRDMSGTQAQIEDYRREEKELDKKHGPGTSRAHWIQNRRRVLQLGQTFRALDRMVYWSERAVPPDELEMVYDELVKVVAHGVRLEAAVDAMRGDRRLREKIKALRAKADSTEYPGEAEVFRAKARQLESGLK